MATVAELVTKFIADTSQFKKGTEDVKKETEGLNNTNKKATKLFDGMNISMLKSAAAMAGLAVGIKTVINVTKQAVQVFAEFEQSMANVRSVTKATDEEFLKLNQAAKAAGETTRFSANQAADALYYLASAGLSATEATEALEGVLLLAGATGSDLASTASTMTAILSQYSLESEESARVSNVFAAAIANSQANMDKLSNAFLQVGPVAAGLGITLEETTGALQVLFNAGFKGEQAGRALKSALADLANESGVANLKLSALGVSFESVNPEANDLATVIGNLQKASLSTAQVIDVFGKVAGPQLSVLIKEGEDALKEYTQAVTDTNEAAEQYAIQNDTLQGDLDILKSVAQGTAIEFSEGVAPAMRLAVRAVTDLLTFIKPLIALIAQAANVGASLGQIFTTSVTKVLAFTGEQITSLLNKFDELVLRLKSGAEESALFGRAMEFVSAATERVISRNKRLREETNELVTSRDNLVSIEEARLLVADAVNRRLEEQAALEAELAEKERQRIQTFVDARTAAETEYGLAQRSAQIRLREGLITQKEYNDELIKANDRLVQSLIDVGYNGLEGNIGANLFQRAIAEIKELTAANEALAESEVVLKDNIVDLKEERRKLAELEIQAAKASKQALEEQKTAAQELKQDVLGLILSLPGQIQSVFQSLDGLHQANTNSKLAALDAEAAARIAAGEDEVAVAEEVERKKAEIEYRGALSSWKLQLASAVAGGAQAIINGFKTQPFIPLGLIAGALATTLTGIQIATVAKNKPQKSFETGTQGFKVPDGYPNDTYRVGLTSGEEVTVRNQTQQQYGGERIQEFRFYFDTEMFYRMINKGGENRKVRIPA